MRRRLVLIAIATTSMVALAFAVPLALLVRTVAEERTLGGVEVSARALAPVLTATDTDTDLQAAVSLSQSTLPGILTVYLPDGTRFGPPTARDRAFMNAADGQASRTPTTDGWRMLVPVLRSDGIAVVEVAVPHEATRVGVGRAWAVLAMLAVMLITGAVLVADRLGRTTVVAVRELGTVAERLGQGDLDARARVTEPPEVAAVASTLYTLAARIRRLLAAEREAAADLSHRLRTPLTALRLDVEALPPSPTADRLAEDVDELERAVDAVITESRRATQEHVAQPLRLDVLVRDRAAFWAVLAEDQDRSFEVEVASTPAVVTGHPEELASALDALLGNVFAHTDEGTGMALRLTTIDDTHIVTVDDDGPGLPDDLVLLRGVSAAGSTGLGLDIARRAAEATGGELRWGRSPIGGARVSFVLPATHLDDRRHGLGST